MLATNPACKKCGAVMRNTPPDNHLECPEGCKDE